MNRAQYGNQTQAETVVANNTATNFGRLDGELAQIAQVIVRNTSAGGHVVSITTAKKTVGAVIGSSGVGSTANVVATDATTFDKVLANTDTTVQAALDKIDEVAQRKDSIGATIVAATAKTTPIDADSVGISDSADGGILKKLSLGNMQTLFLQMDGSTPTSTEVGYSFIQSSTNTTVLSTAVSNSGVYFDIISTGTNAVGCTLTEGTWKIDCDFSVTAGLSAGQTSVYGALTNSSNTILARASIGHFTNNANLANGASCSHVVTVANGATLAIKLRGVQLWHTGSETFSTAPTFIASYNRLIAIRIR
jgi:hypothetical protein